MPRNTFIFVFFLACIAGIVTLVNIFYRPQLSQIVTETPPATPTLIPTPTLLFYTNEPCKLSFQYPDTFTSIDLENGGGAVIVSKIDEKEKLTFFCQENMPIPKELEESNEYTVGTISALLKYPDATKSADTANRLYFKLPNSDYAVLLSGTSTIFQQIISSLYLR